jgi:hypothetical protein
MRIISKHAFNRMCEEFKDKTFEVEMVNDCFVKIILETGEIVEYILYTELMEIKKKHSEGQNWIRVAPEDITNPWVYGEISIINEIYLAKVKNEVIEYYVLCYRDIAIDIFESRNDNIEIKFRTFKPFKQSYILEVFVEGKSINSIFDVFGSEEEVMKWVEKPDDFQILM